jgi:hypothetical protein
MDGISIYTQTSQDWHSSGLSARQRQVDAGRKDEEAAAEKISAKGKDSGDNPSGVRDKVTLSAEAQQKLRELSTRDQQVRAHENAHAAVGGRYAGPPKLQYEEGPDGRPYAVAGEVSINLAEIPGDPEQTLEKAEIVRRTALAPQNPSSADRVIAAEATRMAAEARQEIIAEKNEDLQGVTKSLFRNDSEKLDPSLASDTGTDSTAPVFSGRGRLLNIRT